MKKIKRLLVLMIILLLGTSLVSLGMVDSIARAESITPTGATTATAAASQNPTAAPSATPTPKPRLKTTREEVTGYLWWLVEWKSNAVRCELTIDHEGLPIGSDVLNICGQKVFETWFSNSGSCISPNPAKDEKPCDGLYMFLVKQVPTVHETTQKVAPPGASIALSTDCTAVALTQICGYNPSLVISANEPMDGQSIVSIEADLEGKDHIKCAQNPCRIALSETGPQGVRLTFWANSSFGDSSSKYTAVLRVVKIIGNNSRAIESLDKWRVDVISAQWAGAPVAACAQTWEALPDAGGLPDWLGTPARIESMASSNKYYYLAGALIRAGQVSVQGCPNYGLESPYIANACGLQKSALVVARWQNQFDQTILAEAKNQNIPAMLIKNIIGRESQFWPGVYSDMNEVGLGQLTDGGADTLFLWDPQFYNQFCSRLFEQAECDKGYNNIPEYEKALLKGALLSAVNTSCSGCLASVNIEQANFSVNVLSSSLKANCEQTGQLVYNLTGKSAGLSASYDDLWRFTLVNYNAGAGCLAESIKKTIAAGTPLTWNNIANNLVPSCQGAIGYVADITQNSDTGGDGREKAFLPLSNSVRDPATATPAAAVPTPTLIP